MEENFKFVLKTDVEPLVRLLNAMPQEKWFQFTKRQEFYEVHRYTQTIPFKWIVLGPKRSDFKHPDMPELELEVNKLANELREHVSGNAIKGIVLLRLPAGKGIAPHTDTNFAENNHRYHLPVITHPDVTFCVGGEVISMSAGSWHEINNLRDHWVKNQSTIDRVHLVVDVEE